MVTLPNWPSRASLEWAYREWLFAEATREANSGAPKVLAIRSQLAAFFSAVTEGWSAEAIAELMHVKIKQARYLSIQPLPFSPGEEAIGALIQWPIVAWSTPGRRQVVIDYPWRRGFSLDADKEAVALLDLRIARGEFRVAKQFIRKCFRQALKPLLGGPFEAGGHAYYWTPLDDVTVETVTRVASGGIVQCEYWHRILPGRVDKSNQVRPGEELLLRCSMSDLLGVHLTQWECMTEADVPVQAELLRRLVEDFLNAVPGIVAAARNRGASVG